MQSEVSDFLRYCRLERRLADLTCSAYERDVTACMRFLLAEGFCEWAAVRPPDLRGFLAAEAVTRPAASSQARTVAALKGFFRFCVENEYLERNPALVLRTPKKREALPDVLDRRELARLLATTESEELWQRNFPGKRERDRLMLALFAFAGLRRSELLGLDWDDVNLERRTLRIRRAKGGRQRTVPLHPALVPLVVDYAALRAADAGAGALCRRAGQAALADDPHADLPALRTRRRRRRAQTRDAAHAPTRVRVRTTARGREPTSDPGSCSGTSTSTRRSATPASRRTSCAAPSSASAFQSVTHRSRRLTDRVELPGS